MTSKNPIVQKALNATTKTCDPNRRPSVLVGEINRKCPKLSAKVDAWFVRVEFRDKKGVKGRLSDAIMAEPGFPRDKLEVARADADGVLFTVKGSPSVNAKFAVTTKSGRSVVIEAPNYKAAEKEAKRRFGAGCIVDLVGFTKPDVQNFTATNAKFGDGTSLATGIYVKKAKTVLGDSSRIGKIGFVVRVYDEGGDGAEAMVRYPGSTDLFGEDSRSLIRIAKSEGDKAFAAHNMEDKMKSNNPIVQNALNATALNAGASASDYVRECAKFTN